MFFFSSRSRHTSCALVTGVQTCALPLSPVPLEQIVGDVVDNLSATAKAELALLEARSELALHGATWTAAWGTVAASALGIAMLALAFGAIQIGRAHV